MSAAHVPPAGAVVLRDVLPADVTEIASLEHEAFGAGAWSGAVVEQEVTAPGRRTLVAVGGDGVVGYAVTWTSGEVADVQRVVVAASARRGGLATRLLRGLLTAAAAAGAQRVLLEVSEHNRAALALYQRSGFRELDRRLRYYQDGSDAVVLQLDLTTRTVMTPGTDREQETP